MVQPTERLVQNLRKAVINYRTFSISFIPAISLFFIFLKNLTDPLHSKQEPWRLPSRQAEFNGTDRLRLGARSDYQAVASNKGYFALKLN